MKKGFMHSAVSRLPAFIIIISIVSLSFFFAFTRGAIAQSGVVLGPKTWEQWQAEAAWDNYSAGSYSPPEAKVRRLAQLVESKHATFILFGGSWCPDSKVQLPVIFRLFELASIPQDRLQLYGVDRNRREPTQTAEKYNIDTVPTIIVLSNDKEIGRIADFPRPTWEDDLIRILSE